MIYEFFPEDILHKSVVNSCGERGWKPADVEAAIQAGRSLQLACVDGGIQFLVEEGICEPYWISLKAASRLSGEPWDTYVNRTANEVLQAFKNLIASSDFDEILKNWPRIHSILQEQRCKAEDSVIVLLDWESEI
jgi:hypothetical protein